MSQSQGLLHGEQAVGTRHFLCPTKRHLSWEYQAISMVLHEAQNGRRLLGDSYMQGIRRGELMEQLGKGAFEKTIILV